jgi:hypothetical protein
MSHYGAIERGFAVDATGYALTRQSGCGFRGDVALDWVCGSCGAGCGGRYGAWRLDAGASLFRLDRVGGVSLDELRNLEADIVDDAFLRDVIR